MTSAGVSGTNVTLNLTLNNGTTTGAKAVYYSNTTRLQTQYGQNAILDLIYDGSAWRILNPYTNSNTIGVIFGVVKAGTNGVKNYGLAMKDASDRYSSFTTSAGTGTSKSRYTGGFKILEEKPNIIYNGSNSAYTADNNTGTMYNALGINLQYSTNCGTGLTAGLPVYLVGTISNSDGLFYLASTWWTQTVPTTSDGKIYIYLGIAYSTTNIYLAEENTMYQYVALDEITGFFPLKWIREKVSRATLDVLSDEITSKVSDSTFALLQSQVEDLDMTAHDALDEANSANNALTTYKQTVRNTYSTKTQTSNSISQAISSQENTFDGKLSSAKSELQQKIDGINASIESDGTKLAYFKLEQDGFYIGSDNDTVMLKETGSTVQFIERTSGKILLEINADGMDSTQVTVEKQLIVQNNDDNIWAIRKGAQVNGKNNLNIVWIGD